VLDLTPGTSGQRLHRAPFADDRSCNFGAVPEDSLNGPREVKENEAERTSDRTLEIRQTLRQTALAERDALPPDLRHRLSMEIMERLRSHLANKTYRFLHCYISFRSEAETREFIETMLTLEGVRVVVPVVEQMDEREFLVHTEIRGLKEMRKGRFGLEEPVERSPSSLEALDAVIMPVAAFDRGGGRLGYGKGFYDKFLRELPREVERIGLAFAMQEVVSIPLLPHDESLDIIITEREIIHVGDKC
jgi:5-formyltetrahydrofolate cyclo-ligase